MKKKKEEKQIITLGEFRKETENLPDDAIIFLYIEGPDCMNFSATSLYVENKPLLELEEDEYIAKYTVSETDSETYLEDLEEFDGIIKDKDDREYKDCIFLSV